MPYELYLCHHGIKGMHWGVRRYQNADGSYTNQGKKRYGSSKSLRGWVHRQNAIEMRAQSDRYRAIGMHKAADRFERKAKASLSKADFYDSKKAQAITEKERRQKAKRVDKQVKNAETEYMRNALKAYNNRARAHDYYERGSQLQSTNKEKAAKYFEKANLQKTYYEVSEKKRKAAKAEVDKILKRVKQDPDLLTHPQGRRFYGTIRDTKGEKYSRNTRHVISGIAYDRTKVRANTKKERRKNAKRRQTYDAPVGIRTEVY